MEISSLRGSPEAALIAWFPDQGVLWLDGSSIILLRFIAVPKSYSGFGSCIFLARSFEVVAYGFCGWRGLFRPQDSCIPDAVYSIFKVLWKALVLPFTYRGMGEVFCTGIFQKTLLIFNERLVCLLTSPFIREWETPFAQGFYKIFFSFFIAESKEVRTAYLFMPSYSAICRSVQL